MRVLIANDDGIDALGIQTLYRKLALSYSCVVVAPDRNRSGASNSLTLSRPIQSKQIRENEYSVDGTPADCVNLALSEVISGSFDLVVSGINHGPNLGDDVIYSGTVAAAMEARHLGRSSIAISLHGTRCFDTAAQILDELLKDSHTLSLPKGVLLNVNVPDLPYDQLKGIKITRLGYRKSPQPAISAEHPRGISSFWIGELSEPHDGSEGTDFWAVENGYVSITPLHIDMTCYQVMSSLEKWTAKVLL
ncbi:5'/3'-nucleotidase SurE [Marinomonas sp. 15G1-11]|uniref:5'-nucleotidase SurE n=1 Tax=Marinomonas phaeophyticola TaxID=3004091 RepID=A0ABT4JTR5_9GAMM|nr:5'/3'-nucleotidase SurE [Marinomonas sp. 15G1-11]MCZ2721730.1 5'/3'-nucleotidase SurE [Marinomonas sp. 15G1-11]